MVQTRRDFLKSAALGVTGFAALGALGGCASDSKANTSQEPELQQGCFSATASGAKGDITAYVTLDNGKITSVAAGPNEESWGPGTQAIELLSKQVVDKQSFRIDTISGATLTSMGYLAAIEAALDKAGAKSAFDAPAITESEERPNEEHEVVIVGAGSAGLMAALNLKCPNYDNQANDRDIVVLEKTDIVGGSSQLCFGGLAVGDGLEANNVTDHHSTPAEMVEVLRSRGTTDLNEALALDIMTRSGKILTDLTEYGGPYAPKYAGTLRNYGGHKYLQMDAHSHFLLSEVEGSLGCYSNQGGYALTHFLETKVRQLGIEIRTGSEVVELVVENDSVVGVRVAQGDGSYEVRAKKVVLACGGFGHSEERMRELTGSVIGEYIPFCGAGSTGDAFTLTESLKTSPVGKGAFTYFSLNDSHYGMYSDLNNAFRQRKAILVDEGGNRFCDESSDEYAIGYQITQSKNGRVFVVVDSENPNIETFEKWIDRGKVVKADTLENLAEQAGIDATGLAKTVESYNSAHDAGNPAEFGTALDNMYPVRTAPFYAGELRCCIIGTLVGLKVNEHCQPLNTGGAPIENLYAIGETCLGGNVLADLYAGGVSIATALGTGQIVAEHISASL